MKDDIFLIKTHTENFCSGTIFLTGYDITFVTVVTISFTTIFYQIIHFCKDDQSDESYFKFIAENVYTPIGVGNCYNQLIHLRLADFKYGFCIT